MDIRKLLFWIILGLFICVFEKIILVTLIAIAIYLGIEIIKELKNLN